ncbi:nucleotide sugar dehydrogenase [Rhodoferax saidenbachensis]|uniref:UDP-N-acetyl-D-galactosamine dehydrogenase n=1 Tax=Rhodoferax saidenbachensis TaxID=1484693 RepID=A0ABU1ZKH9_9BURK|nr:nucleotide sugar dehydrogenase [Rhodoferax saidenbachensis]MDR7306054.1 UDP-N-acetyl-D-galactosamine dehydrogenase [Rhodoferax saidenbachensis]
MLSRETTVAIVGLGYVGLPLAVEFGKKYKTIGYDSSEGKVLACREHRDPSGELSAADLRAATLLEVTADPHRLAEADFVIVAVPTPVDAAHIPDFSPLVGASTVIGRHIRAGVTVVYESTVFPGATEEVCIPVLEKESGFKWLKDFHVGYSPERVNPGDKDRTITKIVKVVAGDDEATLQRVGDLYESIITAGVHRASSIKVAEAAKVIENTQRDLNIALMNELSIIFDKLNIDTLEVLSAAGTKWNFLPFRPGLVGGHCIGVDPYYLTHKAEMLGYNPQVILAGRRINDGMAAYVAQQTVKQMSAAGGSIKGAKVIVLGLAFKENCLDIRNSKVADLVRELEDYGCEVIVHDPIAIPAEAQHEYGITLTPWESLPIGDALVVAVSHRQYLQMDLDDLLEKLKPTGVFVDVKSNFSQRILSEKGLRVWRL